MPQHLVFAVHGFLGEASDWDKVKNTLPSVQFVTPDLFKATSQAVEDLDTYVDKLVQKFELQPRLHKNIFIGYSLGGRIGLQILEKYPELFDQFIFLSTNPGLSSEAKEEREARQVSDHQWAEKIAQLPWSQFLRDWNSQGVFAGSNHDPERSMQKFDLAKLQQALAVWSLAKQKDFSEVIRAHQAKIIWVVGAQDQKYSAIASTLKQKEILLDYKRISSGHRVLLDNPEAITRLLQDGFNIGLNPV